MTQNIIQAHSIIKDYISGENVTRAVDAISFDVRAGEFAALVGPSGSGKTTLLAILAAMLNTTGGEVIVDGVAINTLKESERIRFRREKIGFSFQSNNLIPYLTVRENVEWMLRLNGRLDEDGRTRVLELLTALGLENRLDYLPSQLSGGQRQRVAIARSVIHNPRLVLADEPTANLDTERAHQVVQVFADLIHRDERCGIIVTHDLRMCKYVDKVFQIEDGKLTRTLTDPVEIASFSRSH